MTRKVPPLSATTHTPPGEALVLVDDDPAVLHALSFAFETQGYDVHPYADAEALLASPANLPGPACFVVDQKLPGRSGLQLLQELRARAVTAPVILITSNPTVQVRAAAAAAGVEIVEKPLLGGTLEKKVREALSRSLEA
jgi:FixJ family two-component response regulator